MNVGVSSSDLTLEILKAPSTFHAAARAYRFILAKNRSSDCISEKGYLRYAMALAVLFELHGIPQSTTYHKCLEADLFRAGCLVPVFVLPSFELRSASGFRAGLKYLKFLS